MDTPTSGLYTSLPRCSGNPQHAPSAVLILAGAAGPASVADRWRIAGRGGYRSQPHLTLKRLPLRAPVWVLGGTALERAMNDQWRLRLSDQAQASTTAPGAEVVSWGSTDRIGRGQAHLSRRGNALPPGHRKASLRRCSRDLRLTERTDATLSDTDSANAARPGCTSHSTVGTICRASHSSHP